MPRREFPPKGQPQIHGVNRIGLWSLYMKEVRRFLKVHTQTIWAPAVTTLLFLVIFTVAMGRGDRQVLGVSFATFGTIIDLLMPPLTNAELMAGIVAAAITRAVLVGGALWLAMALWPGVEVTPVHPWAAAWFGFHGACFLALLGLVTSLWAEKFDHAAAVTNFVVAPLSLLSGTFYVISNLSPLFQTISRLNPFFYMISGFRFGFLGQSDIGNSNHAVIGAALGVGILNLVFGFVVYRLLRTGWKLKS